MSVAQDELNRMLDEHIKQSKAERIDSVLRLYANEYVELDMQGRDLKNSIGYNSHFVGCNFSRVDMSDVIWNVCTFTNCVFDGANLSKTIIRNSKFLSCSIKGANLNGAAFSRSEFVDCDFEGSKMLDTDFYKSSFHSCEFPNVAAQGVKHYQLFSWMGLGEEASSLVFNFKTDQVWFKEFRGTLKEFTKKLVNKEFKLDRLEHELLLQISNILFQYISTDKEEEARNAV